LQDFRVGIAGLGRCGDVHRDAWQSLGEGTRLQAICDESLAIRMRAASTGLPVYEDADAMLDAEALDAVSICTPPSSHRALAETFLRRGIPVLCEKPMATDLGDAFRLFDVAESSKVPFALATKFRLVPEVRMAKQFIEAGEIGDILTFRVEFASFVDMSTRWNCLPEVAGGGVIIDNGCHAFDLVQFLFGSVETIRATRLKQAQEFPVEDTAIILAGTQNGVVGEVFLSWSLFTGSPNYVTISGTKGTIEIGWQKSTIKRLGQQPEEFGGAYSKHVAHKNLVQAFKGSIQDGAPLWITPSEAIETAYAVEAAYRSMKTGGLVAMASARVRANAR
jgi:predicted dehydrogenase